MEQCCNRKPEKSKTALGSPNTHCLWERNKTDFFLLGDQAKESFEGAGTNF
jgi:hypothetical protein